VERSTLSYYLENSGNEAFSYNYNNPKFIHDTVYKIAQHQTSPTIDHQLIDRIKGNAEGKCR